MNTTRKIIILLTFPLSMSMKFLVAGFVLIIFVRLQDYLKPYKDDAYNSVEILGTSTGIITIGSGLIYSQNNTNDSLDLIVLVIVIVFNSYFFMQWIYLLCLCFRKTSQIALIVTLKYLIRFRELKYLAKY